MRAENKHPRHKWCRVTAWIQNKTVHTTIKRTPYEALFGRLSLVTPFGLPAIEKTIDDSLEIFLDLRSEHLKILTDDIRNVIYSMRHTLLDSANRNRKFLEFLIGDEIVVCRNHSKALLNASGDLYLVIPI
jgi:hypothetical protein